MIKVKNVREGPSMKIDRMTQTLTPTLTEFPFKFTLSKYTL